ncbi:S-DNA-T family DNA segregation ATPase FtsK/SpoIIIE [Geomicrobium halophilum]|uniref:S-DNA-T family DNA segregation ATPase FtsK/SpoIIIE n=1 Tax=Geomicrobium halophilum TaxID=549000 RepID=A0A841PZ33_9BACL|nr:S-DNA-T family DNA segregation ATPase FtsK/SpoIIIE [Geomicrobium halophilum]
MNERRAKRKLKQKLTDCFHAAGIYLDYKSDKGGKYKQFIYPKIHDIDATERRLRFVFTLPNGFDPVEVTKKKHVFRQFFGSNTEVDGDDVKTFVVRVYAQGLLKSFNWRYADINPVLDGKEVPIYCGKDAAGYHVAYDMTDYHHLLIAGETGSGKSTQVRSVLTSLIRHMSPDRLHMYLADIKRSEFHVFRHVEHVRELCTDATHLRAVLTDLDVEIGRRGALLEKYGAANVTDLAAPAPPFILVCVDEVALLKDEKAITDILEKISSQGRALGMFLILSMQRPDAKVLDGKLKVNLTVRMGFRSADRINSRIIGTPGSEKLNASDSGRMLMKLEEINEVQSPWLDVDDARTMLDPYRVAPPPPQPTVEAAEKEKPVPPQETPKFGVLNVDDEE